jgi:hypothetical protein
MPHLTALRILRVYRLEFYFYNYYKFNYICQCLQIMKWSIVAGRFLNFCVGCGSPKVVRSCPPVASGLLRRQLPQISVAAAYIISSLPLP